MDWFGLVLAEHGYVVVAVRAPAGDRPATLHGVVFDIFGWGAAAEARPEFAGPLFISPRRILA